ncbi:MAG: type II toxin-antitoxin system HicB family antitoxin [Anaerotignum propionicum]|uniref:type II toxin-antitoxin system HicB family antitoxin n=1 Tax=Anaerotignum propionicum TaxID=28446 RepID=UPI002B1FFEC2|nr:type II toxin-antitoxin system HicB family antitoxin [Anaerotignum propionicum]MEA5057235.1 type II toxin-antitoxin system HicB family antitoxin [Anaerotignum propionicum]
MKKVYPVIFTHDADVFLVEVPDLEILTEGSDLVNAIYMARDAIGLKGIAIEDEGDEVPEPSEVENIDVKKSVFYKDKNSFISLVDIDFSEYRRRHDNKMVRRNVTLPNWMNVAAEKENINVSKVLQEALSERLQIAK